MVNYLKSEYIEESKDYIEGIPVIRLYPKNTKGLVPTIVFYHGWSSDKESQRIRGLILSNLGYQVIIPEAIHHGERGLIDYSKPEIMLTHFWPLIFNNLREFQYIREYAINNYKADPDRIAVSGHSMGGFTAAGVFTHNPDIKTVVVLNGSFNWKHSNSIFKKVIELDSLDEKELEEREKDVNSIDPMNHLKGIKDRPILMLHGAADSVVNVESQRIFYDKLSPLYSDKNLIDIIEYNNLDHFVTTNMMEDMAIWFKKYL